MQTESVLWPTLEGRRLLLGVSGGIAAYKVAELCRLLQRCGAEVQVMMTASAQRFVGELTFGALTGRSVATDLFDPAQESQIGHIGLADRADLLLLAPATANILAKLACGLADDLVSTVSLAFSGPLLLAPAMNVQMWQNQATQENLITLRRRGARVVGPALGEMACGHTGAGRLAEPEEILQAAGACLAPQDLAGRRILVTAGPTHEPLDPVRFIGNRSSGKMGFALAAEAASRGARVTLVSGPSALATPWGVEREEVRTAAEMNEAVQRRVGAAEVVIMAAAVADYRPEEVSIGKIKKSRSGEGLTLRLTRTEDILARLGARRRRPFLVGFAAETTSALGPLAQEKLVRKRCDLLVANDVSAPGAGFEVDTNHVVICDSRGGRETIPQASKRRVAAGILDRLVQALTTKRAVSSSRQRRAR